MTSALHALVEAVEATLDDESLTTDLARVERMVPALRAVLDVPGSVPGWAEEPFEGGAVGNLLHADGAGRFHVLAVVFPEGTSSGVHFHGCWGVIGYLRGGDEETRFVVDDDGSPSESSRHIWHRGDITFLLPEVTDGRKVGPGGCWHRVRNPGPGVGVSVHVLCRTPGEHPHSYWDRTNRRTLDFPFFEVAPDRWVARVQGLDV